MEYVFEFILELLLEGAIEAGKCEKIPKPIRYIIIAIISLFFLSIIGIIALTGILIIEKNTILGILLIIASLALLIGCIQTFMRDYLNKKRDLETKRRNPDYESKKD